MKLKNATSAIFGLLTCAACITCGTIAHYADDWSVCYPVGILFAVFAGLAVELSKQRAQ